MQIPFVDLKAQWAELEPQLRSAIDAVFASCAFAGGPAVEEFESRFARYCGTEHCVAVGSGTAALEIILRGYGIGAGDEIILPANTFVAAAEAIALLGAKPVFVDVRAETANLNPDLLSAAVTQHTKAIMPVHLYGQPAEMQALLELAEDHRFIVVEDASQAHGAKLSGKRAGCLADAAAFSFYPAKNLGAAGEAGCITTNDAELARRARMLRDHGSSRKYVHELLGRNDRIDTIQAAVLNVKLEHLDRWNEQRRRIAQTYQAAFGEHPQIRPLSATDDCDPVYHLFVVRVPQRDELRKRLLERGIATGIHYPVPLHLQPVYASLGYQTGDFPVSETLADEILSLPMYPQLSDEQVGYVVDALRSLV